MENLPDLDRAGQVEFLRSRMAAIGGGRGAVAQPQIAGPDLLPVPSDLAKVLPGGGLARRAVTEVSDCPALIVQLIVQATAGDGHVGVVGWPELSLAGVIDNGRLEKIITVPDPGSDPLGVIGVLVEGLDLVVARWPAPLELSPVRARPMLGKLRGGVAALVLVGARVPSPTVRIQADVTTFRGIGEGTGRIRGVDIAVRVEAKGKPPASTTVTVGRPAGLRTV
nr:hypothetical protein [Corynebacterium comes]